MVRKIVSAGLEWADRVDARNGYKFGEEEINLEDFAKLVKDTFEAIRFVKNQHIYKQNFEKLTAYDTFSYLQLLADLSKYSTYDYDIDESADNKFTATCLVAQKLVEYAVYPDPTDFTDGGVVYSDFEESAAGKFTFCGEDYPFDLDDKTYNYDVYEADFSEVIELAKSLCEV